MIEMINDLVAITWLKEEPKHGIIKPDTSKEIADMREKELRGRVDFVGPGRLSDSKPGERLPMSVRPGDIVVWDDRRAMVGWIAGAERTIIPEGGIIAILERAIKTEAQA